MTSNIALDVCIGLIFIFLLYRLMASTLLEIFARIFDLRARNLLRGLRRMLEDTKPQPWQHSTLLAWAIEFAKDLIYYFAPTKGSLLLEKFYNHPSIKYLGENTVRSKPAYIYSSTFSKTIIQILRTGLLNPALSDL